MSQKKIKPEISIIIPSFNKEDIILETLASVYASDHKGNFEVFVVDDNSSDPKTLEAYKISKDIYPDLEIVKNHNKPLSAIGPASARNFGLLRAKGQFVVFIDSDDLITPRYLSTLLRELKNNNKLSFVYTDMAIFGSCLGFREMPQYSRILLKKLNYIPISAMIKRSALNDVGGFRTDLFAMEDWDLFLRLSLKGHDGKKVDKNNGGILLYRIIKGKGVNQSAWSPGKRAKIRTTIQKINGVYNNLSIMLNYCAIIYGLLMPIQIIAENKKYRELSGELKNIINETIKNSKKQ